MRLEPLGEVVGVEEVAEMPAELVVALVGVASDSRLLERTPLDLSVRPGMVRLGQAMVNVVLGASQVEGMTTKQRPVGKQSLDVRRRPSASGRVGEMRAVVGKRGMKCDREVPPSNDGTTLHHHTLGLNI